MASAKTVLFGSGNRSNKEVDLIDLIALGALPIFVSFLFGVTSFEVSVFGGYDLTTPVWTISTLDISVTLIICVFASVWIIVTNLLNEQTDQTGIEFAVIGTAIALPILYELIPAVADLVMWNDWTQIAFTLYVVLAAVYVSYVG